MNTHDKRKPYLRSPTTDETLLVDDACKELMIRNHASAYTPFILCSIVCCLIGVLTKQIFLPWIFVTLMIIMCILTLIQKKYRK